MGFRIRLKSGRDLVVGWLKEGYTIPSDDLPFTEYLNNLAFDVGTSLFKFRRYSQNKTGTYFVDVNKPYIEDTPQPTEGYYIEQLADNLWAYNIQSISQAYFNRPQYIGYESIILNNYYTEEAFDRPGIWGVSFNNYITNETSRYNDYAPSDPDKTVLVFVPFGQKPGNITNCMIMVNSEFVDSTIGNTLIPKFRGRYQFWYLQNKQAFLDFLNGGSLVEEQDSSPVGDDKGDFDTTSDIISAPSLDDINISSAISTNILKAYELTNVNVQSLAAKLWDDSFISSIKKIQNSPLDNIVRLHCLPFNVSSGAETPVYVGNVNMDFNAKVIENQFQEVDFGTLELSEFYGNSLDYTATEVSIFLPFIGTQKLEISDVGSANLHLKYRIDVLTGNCTALINVARNRDDTNLNSILYQFTGNCSNEFPLNQRTNSTLVKMFDSAINVASNPKNVGQWLSMGSEVFKTGLGGMSETVQRSGNLTGSSGYMGILDAYLIIDRPINIKPKDFKKLFGYPSYYTVPLVEAEGYTKVNTLISLPPSNVPSEDWNRVIELLKEGIYIGDYYRNPIEPLPPEPGPEPGTLTVDSELSTTSTNPVQNRAITQGINTAKEEAITSSNAYSDNVALAALNEAKEYTDGKLFTLKHKDFEIEVSFPGGTVGTRGFQTSLNYDSEMKFENIVSIEIAYIEDSSVMFPMVFRTNNYIYINAYRTTTNAVNNNTIRIRVVYT